MSMDDDDRAARGSGGVRSIIHWQWTEGSVGQLSPPRLQLDSARSILGLHKSNPPIAHQRGSGFGPKSMPPQNTLLHRAHQLNRSESDWTAPPPPPRTFPPTTTTTTTTTSPDPTDHLAPPAFTSACTPTSLPVTLIQRPN
jgi:hypothetical protein